MNEAQSHQAIKARLRRVSLAFMGEEWTDAYVDFRYLTWDDTKKIRGQAKDAAAADSDDAYIEALIDTVKTYLTGGQVLNPASELVEIAPEMIDTFDLDAIQVLYQRLMGVPDPNASTPSNGS